MADRQTEEQPVFYVKSPSGTYWKEENKTEVDRLLAKEGWQLVPLQEVEAAFADKERAFGSLDAALAGQLAAVPTTSLAATV